MRYKWRSYKYKGDKNGYSGGSKYGNRIECRSHIRINQSDKLAISYATQDCRYEFQMEFCHGLRENYL